MKDTWRHIASAAVMPAMLVLVLGGCETTGDPRQGGLFGWSEAKARDRQADLEAQELDARQAAEAEKQRGVALSRRQGELRSEVGDLQTQVARLLSENTKLDDEVRALMARRQIGSAELLRLRETLAANERLRAQARQTAAQPASPQSAAQLSQQSETLNRYNQQLYREVLLMMGR